MQSEYFCHSCGVDNPNPSLGLVPDSKGNAKGVFPVCSVCGKEVGKAVYDASQTPASKPQQLSLPDMPVPVAKGNPTRSPSALQFDGTPRGLLKSARARIKELNALVKDRNALIRERDELKRLVAASRKPRPVASVRSIRHTAS